MAGKKKGSKAFIGTQKGLILRNVTGEDMDPKD